MTIYESRCKHEKAHSKKKETHQINETLKETVLIKLFASDLYLF